MKVNNLIMGVISIMICALLVGTALLPAINSASSNADIKTYYNDDGTTFREMREGDVFEGMRTVSESGNIDVWYLNGEPINLSISDWDNVLMTNGVYVRANSSTSSSFGAYYVSSNPTSQTNMHSSSTEWCKFVFTAGADSIVITKMTSNDTEPSEIGTYPYTWGFVACPVDQGAYMASSSANGTGYVLSDSEIILCGAYTTGDLDTMYFYHDGTFSTATDTITGTADIERTLVNGTKDVYNVSVSVNLTNGTLNESFEPFKILIPYKITGHLSNGPIANMFGILPFIAIAGLIMAGIYVFISRK